MRRWAINVLCGLSLLIFLLAMGIWVRSYFAGDELRRQRVKQESGTFPLHIKTHQLGWSSGRMIFSRIDARMLNELSPRQGTLWTYQKWEPAWWRIPGALEGTRLEFAGFRWGRFTNSNPGGSFALSEAAVPLWLFVLFAIPPLRWVVRWRGQRGRGFPVEVNAVREQFSR